MILTHKMLINLLIMDHNTRTIVGGVWVNCLHASTYVVSHCLVCCFTRYSIVTVVVILLHIYIIYIYISAAIKQLHLWNTLFGKLEQVGFRNTPECITHLYTHYTCGACLHLQINKCKGQIVEQLSVLSHKNLFIYWCFCNSNPCCHIETIKVD